MPIPRRLEPPRSPKAGRLPEVVTPPPRVRRRQKTAHVAMRKGAGFFQTSEGPRVILGVKKPKAKKR